MTESEWLLSDGFLPRLEWLLKSGKTSERKCLLFAVHCAHLTWRLRSEEEHFIYESAERYAEGEATWEELKEVVGTRTGTARKHLTWLRRFIKYSMGGTTEYAYRRVHDTHTVNYSREAIKRLMEENQQDMTKPHTDEELMMLLQTHMHLKQMERNIMLHLGTVIVK